jgi:phage-related protein
MLMAVFYQTEARRVPVLEWLRDLERLDRKQVGLDLLRVQENWPIGMPVSKSLGKGLWEVRSNLSGGRIARVIFCLRGNEIYILHGFLKTTQKTPKQDLELARRRMKEVLT